MKIQHYSFGRITIGGQTYTSDVLIFPERVNPSWWRRQGHLLQLEDLKEVLNEKPEAIVVGTGYSGVMKVPAQLVSIIESYGIEMHIARTAEAVDKFGEVSGRKKTIACFHLTC